MAITEMQTLLLWALLAKPGGASFQKDIRPEVKKPDRDALVKAGLITKEKRGRAGNSLPSPSSRRLENGTALTPL